MTGARTGLLVASEDPDELAAVGAALEAVFPGRIHLLGRWIEHEQEQDLHCAFLCILHLGKHLH